MFREDLNTLAKIGSVLWVDPEYSERSTLETITAVSLLRLDPEKSLEKASAALLERARSQSLLSNSPHQVGMLGKKFFRLNANERFLMVALHGGHWSYERLSQIFCLSSEQLQEFAWRVRIQLGQSASYPAGPSPMGPRCPDYDPRRPWTQRFLDNEISSRQDQIFLQRHLIGCAACAKAFSRCREIYFRVEKEVAQVLGEELRSEGFARDMEKTLSQFPELKDPIDRNPLLGVKKILKRWDVIFMLMAGICFWFLKKYSP
jgi:hypothetical protein